MRCQVGVWQFTYERGDFRNKRLHPATFPIALARWAIELFSHRGELVLDPFSGTGTSLIAARRTGRNAIGLDLKEEYTLLARGRLAQEPEAIGSRQVALTADARDAGTVLQPERAALILTSPPYANLLNRRRLNKSRRGNLRANEQYLRVEQYSQDPADLGTLPLDAYADAIEEVFVGLLPLVRPGGHCLVNVPDMWWEDRRVTLHIAVVDRLRRAGYELRNTIIWDRTNIVNRIGIFGWPSNYITMGTTFEYLLDFWRPAKGDATMSAGSS
jgi:DNA modification methylase